MDRNSKPKGKSCTKIQLFILHSPLITWLVSSEGHSVDNGVFHIKGHTIRSLLCDFSHTALSLGRNSTKYSLLVMSSQQTEQEPQGHWKSSFKSLHGYSPPSLQSPSNGK